MTGVSHSARFRDVRLPESLRWLFWESSFDELDTERDTSYILARVLEFGCLEDVRWVFDTYQSERVHQFFREVGHPELSNRTLAFWRTFFQAESEAWASPPAWRTSSSAPWIG